MSGQRQKPKKSTTVRIYEETKERLQKVACEKTGREKRVVTEVELADTAVEQWLNKEEKKLGI